MERLVVDASVIVKWYINEKYSEKALKLRDKHVNGEILLMAPSLLPYEVINALRYSNLYTLEELKLATASLLNYGIQTQPITSKYMEKVVEVAVKNGITIYDASYIALAITKNVKMVTSDEKLIERVKPETRKIIIHIKEIQ